MIRVLVITSWAYNPYEFWSVLKTIRQQGWEFTVISTDSIIEEEQTRNERFKVRTIKEFEIDEIKDYSAVVFVSGNLVTTEKFYFNQKAREIVLEFNRQGKVIAAMCAIVPVIRYVLDGKRVSAFPSLKIFSLLKREGAIVTSNSLEIDGNIITIQHEEVIDEMMNELVRMLSH